VINENYTHLSQKILRNVKMDKMGEQCSMHIRNEKYTMLIIFLKLKLGIYIYIYIYIYITLI